MPCGESHIILGRKSFPDRRRHWDAELHAAMPKLTGTFMMSKPPSPHHPCGTEPDWVLDVVSFTRPQMPQTPSRPVLSSGNLQPGNWHAPRLVGCLETALASSMIWCGSLPAEIGVSRAGFWSAYRNLVLTCDSGSSALSPDATPNLICLGTGNFFCTPG